MSVDRIAQEDKYTEKEVKDSIATLMGNTSNGEKTELRGGGIEGQERSQGTVM